MNISTVPQDLAIDLRQLVMTIANTVDLVGVDDLLHGRRVGILNNKLAALGSEVDGGDYKPTEQVKAVHKEIVEKIDLQLNQLNKVMTEKVPRFNDLVKQKQVSAVSIDLL